MYVCACVCVCVCVCIVGQADFEGEDTYLAAVRGHIYTIHTYIHTYIHTSYIHTYIHTYRYIADLGDFGSEVRSYLYSLYIYIVDTYADVCWRMLTYATLTYAGVC
jgi:hypothetical protein